MRAIRLPLLCAFAGGCLSNALLFCLWRTPDVGSSARKQHHSPNVVALTTTATAAPDTERPSELGAAHVATHGDKAAAEPAPPEPQPAQDTNSEAAPPAGSAVSDVLTSLEAAYRERVSARAPTQPAATAEAATSAPLANKPIAAPEPAPVAAPQPSVNIPPPSAAAEPAARVTSAPSAPAAAPAAPTVMAPQVAAVPAFAAEDAPPPPAQIHYGDVNQNTYITNVRQGDVYLIQLQQLAVLQYMQLLGASSGAALSARHARGAPPQRGVFPSGIINPDNPWGFHFAPPNLVR